jgi:2-(1,2-epoxy-1,2-dihydrophenyl)acetyl-CoA isomerase
MTNNAVEIERRGHVAILRLNRPDAANTIDLDLARALLDAAYRIQADAGVRAAVLTGAGGSFCFGGDLRGMMATGGEITPFLRELTATLHAAVAQLARMDAPLIAAVNGTTAGAGIGLVALADLAVAAESAKFSLAYTGVGLTPDGGTSFLLPRLVGTKRAMELLLTNRALTAAEARDWGLLNEVVPDAEVLPRALAIAERLAAGEREHRPAGWHGRRPGGHPGLPREAQAEVRLNPAGPACPARASCRRRIVTTPSRFGRSSRGFIRAASTPARTH